MKSLDESWTSMNFLDDNYKLANYLDENFDKLKCMDGTYFKIVMPNENHIYMDEHGTWMKMWMIIGSRRIVWIKLLAGWMYGWK